MLNKKTVFIVGAGASCEAELPAGDKLKEHIATALDIRFDDWGQRQVSGDTVIMQCIWDQVTGPDGRRGDANPLRKKAIFIRDNVRFGAISIDNFIDAHKKDGEIEFVGKLAIARSILQAEAKFKLKVVNDGNGRFDPTRMINTWYMFIHQLLTENLDK